MEKSENLFILICYCIH